jgi:hypothetical protein
MTPAEKKRWEESDAAGRTRRGRKRKT